MNTKCGHCGHEVDPNFHVLGVDKVPYCDKACLHFGERSRLEKTLEDYESLLRSVVNACDRVNKGGRETVFNAHDMAELIQFLRGKVEEVSK